MQAPPLVSITFRRAKRNTGGRNWPRTRPPRAESTLMCRFVPPAPSGCLERAVCYTGEMDVEHRLLAAIEAAPDDPIRKDIFATWLEEHGDPRADFVRAVNSGGDAAAIAQAAGIEYDPADWQTIRRAGLDDVDWRLFALHCVERVLPLFEEAYPADTRPREAVEAARAGENVAQAAGAALAAADDVREANPLASGVAGASIYAASTAAPHCDCGSLAAHAAYKVLRVVKHSGGDVEAEQRWQMSRLGEYKLFRQLIHLLPDDWRG